MRRAVLVLASLALAMLFASVAALVGVQEKAQAAFPGQNGKIFYETDPDLESTPPSEINSVMPDGTQFERLADYDDRTKFGRGDGDHSPNVSADGNKVVFQRDWYGEDGMYISDLYSANIDGTGLKRVTTDTGMGELFPTWSPDGTKIAFSGANYSSDSGQDIYVVNADGTGDPTRITDWSGNETRPAWSPDGAKLLYVSAANTTAFPNPEGDSEIYAMNPNGTGVASRLTSNSAHEEDPEWSPDGTKIAFTRGGGIWKMRADGSNQQKIPVDTSTPPRLGHPWEFVYDSSPEWSPDGTKIAFSRFWNSYDPEWPSDGWYEVQIVNPDGSGLKNVAAWSARFDWGPAPAATDQTAPTVKAPTRNLVAASTIGDSTVPVSLAWSAIDDKSGIARYQLQQSINGGAFADVALPTETATSITPSLEAGKSYRYQVRAQDGVGNWSAWRLGPTFAVDLRQETHRAITYSGTWALQSSPTASGGYVKHASASGAKAKFSFAGKHVAWVASTGSNRGKAAVWVDGAKVKTVDLYAPTAEPRKMVFTKAWSTSANHTVEVRALGTKNAASTGTRVDVDAFVALR